MFNSHYRFTFQSSKDYLRFVHVKKYNRPYFSLHCCHHQPRETGKHTNELVRPDLFPG